MTLYLPEGLRWLGWIAGAEWPDGDEDRAWDVARAWEEASNDLVALLAKIDEAKQVAMAAYSEGAARTEIGARYDALRSGDQSLEQVANLMMTQYDSTFDMGTELQATKLTIIVTLCWLALEIAWAWLFPPTAPAVEAAAIVSTRSILKVIQDFVQKTIQNLATRMGAPNNLGKGRHFWKDLFGPARHWPTAKGWGVYGARAIEGAVVPMAINGSVQAGQIGQGKRHEFNGKEFGLGALGGAAGAIPAREFGVYFSKLVDSGLGKLPANWVYNAGTGAFRGMLIGGTSDAVGATFANLATALAAGGDFSAFGNAAGWVGNIAQGGIVGGARGGAAFNSYIPKAEHGFTEASAMRRDHWRGFGWWLPKFEGPGLFAPAHADSSHTPSIAGSDGPRAGTPPPGFGPNDIALQDLHQNPEPGTTGRDGTVADVGQWGDSGGPQPPQQSGAPGDFGPAASGGQSHYGGDNDSLDGYYADGGYGSQHSDSGHDVDRYSADSNGGFSGDYVHHAGRGDDQGDISGGIDLSGDPGERSDHGAMPQQSWFADSDDTGSIRHATGDVFMSGGLGPPGTADGTAFVARPDAADSRSGHQGHAGSSANSTPNPSSPQHQSSHAPPAQASSSRQPLPDHTWRHDDSSTKPADTARIWSEDAGRPDGPTRSPGLDDISLSQFPLPPTGVAAGPGGATGTGRPAPVPNPAAPVQDPAAPRPTNFSRPFGPQNGPVPPTPPQPPHGAPSDTHSVTASESPAEISPALESGPAGEQSRWSPDSSDTSDSSGSATSERTDPDSDGPPLWETLGVEPGSRAAYEGYRDAYAESRTDRPIHETLGEGKDVRGKPRPQRWPMQVPYPVVDFRGPDVPTDGWLPAGAVPDGDPDRPDDPVPDPGAPVIEPDAVVDPAATVGAGARVGPGATVGAHAEIGAHAVVGSGAVVQDSAVVGEDSEIRSGADIHPGATVGSGAVVGAGAVVLPGAVVPDDAVVAAGDVVGGGPGTGSSGVDVPFTL